MIAEQLDVVVLDFFLQKLYFKLLIISASFNNISYNKISSFELVSHKNDIRIEI